MSALTFYGLANCDSCRNARRWLDANDIDYDYHDVRGDGLTRSIVERWLDEHDWQTVVNRRSATWRSIPEQDRITMDRESAVRAIIELPTLAKRPVLVGADFIEIGFDADRYRGRVSRSGR